MNKEISDLEKYNSTNQSKIKKSLMFLKMREIFLMEEKRLLRHFSVSKEVLHKNQIEKQAEKQAEEKEKKR